MITSNGERQAPLKIEEAEPTHLVRYQFALDYLPKNKIVLDAPCGSGYGTALLASKHKFVYGFDISNEAITHANELFKHRNNFFHIQNIEHLNILPNTHYFDHIVSFEGIEHLQNPESFLKEVKRVLRPEGTLIISTPRKPHGSPHHIIEYSLDEFTNLLSKYFTINNMFGQINTNIFDLNKNPVNPHDYKKFNFIAYCSQKL